MQTRCRHRVCIDFCTKVYAKSMPSFPQTTNFGKNITTTCNSSAKKCRTLGNSSGMAWAPGSKPALWEVCSGMAWAPRVQTRTLGKSSGMAWAPRLQTRALGKSSGMSFGHKALAHMRAVDGNGVPFGTLWASSLVLVPGEGVNTLGPKPWGAPLGLDPNKKPHSLGGLGGLSGRMSGHFCVQTSCLWREAHIDHVAIKG